MGFPCSTHDKSPLHGRVDRQVLSYGIAGLTQLRRWFPTPDCQMRHDVGVCAAVGRGFRKVVPHRRGQGAEPFLRLGSQPDHGVTEPFDAGQRDLESRHRPYGCSQEFERSLIESRRWQKRIEHGYMSWNPHPAAESNRARQGATACSAAGIGTMTALSVGSMRISIASASVPIAQWLVCSVRMRSARSGLSGTSFEG